MKLTTDGITRLCDLLCQFKLMLSFDLRQAIINGFLYADLSLALLRIITDILTA